MSGIIGGGQIGYNYQAGQWVFGLEAMLDASAIKSSQTSGFGAADDKFEVEIKSFLLATGRLGYAWDKFLAYGKAGIAIANISASVTDNVGPTTGAGSDSRWRSGPTVGLGIEYGITPNLSLAVEYDYIRLSAASYQLGGGAGSYLWDLDAHNISQVMAKLNYKIN
jgi:outer membrane immunogenic protein